MSITPFGLSDEQTNQVLSAACRAPSLLNSQPWAFRMKSDRIELHIDTRRTLPVSDPDGRATRLACGAALFNLRLALARRGVLVTATICSPPGPGPLAVIRAGGNWALTPLRAELEKAIEHRRTNRRPFYDTPVPSGDRLTLGWAAEAEDATLQMITDPAKLGYLQSWALAAHRTQWANPAWVAEWTNRTGQENTADGVPMSAAGPAPAPQDRWTLRDFGRPGRPDRIQGKDFEENPLLAVLCSHLDGPRAQVQAGQALERVLLQATGLGLAASLLSQLIEEEPIRRKLADLLGGQIYPQAVLRIGFGGPVPSTPRRPVQDCLLMDLLDDPSVDGR